MSPEQIEGKTQVDGRSDLFSLGVIFYMLLTGERPFTGDSFNTVSYRIVNVHHVPPRTLNPNIPAPYNLILTKLLAKDPADRYQTGAELVHDVKKLIGNSIDIEELTEIDLDSTASLSGSPPPLVPESRGIRAPRDGDASLHNLTLSVVGSRKRMVSLGLLILLVLVLTFGSIYLIHSTSERKQDTAKTQVVHNRPDPVAELSRQNAIRIKWDLAMKYVESGMPDRAIKELKDIVVLDPQNPDARKFLDLVVEKKALEEKKKLEPPPPTPIEIVEAPKPVVKPKPKIEPLNPVTLQPLPEIKLAAIDFEFEHGFPSGSFYIFTNDKLAFEGSLSGEKKKVLIFRNYKGKLTGSLQVAVGKTNVLVHVVCREKGISASKKITVNVEENGQHNLRIKYLKSPKQLELTWT
jgi:hypothetical protein